MDFGDILEEWERQRKMQSSGSRSSSEQKKRNRHGEGGAEESSSDDAGPGDRESVARRELLRWLDGVDNWEEVQRAKEDSFDAGEEHGSGNRRGNGGGYSQKSRRQLRKMAPEDTLDLHGMTTDDAERALRHFMENARTRRLRKVLIIHGKGNHSEGGPVLRDMVRAYLEKNRHAGEMGTPGREYGGSGATWCILK
jgi:DNA-nicking Smr family endonuclease